MFCYHSAHAIVWFYRSFGVGLFTAQWGKPHCQRRKYARRFALLAVTRRACPLVTANTRKKAWLYLMIVDMNKIVCLWPGAMIDGGLSLFHRTPSVIRLTDRPIGGQSQAQFKISPKIGMCAQNDVFLMRFIENLKLNIGIGVWLSK